MKKNKILNSLWYVVPVLLVLAGLIWIGSRPQLGESVASQGNQHIKTADSPHAEYNTTPPTSGPHIGRMASWGIHTEQIPDELQIHNLEDGGVIVHYIADEISQDDLEVLEDIVNSYSKEVILEPYEGLDSLIVLTTWGRIDYLDEADEDAIRGFISSYKGINHHTG